MPTNRTRWVFSGLGGAGAGGGGGPQIMKELMCVFGTWIIVKTWIHSNRPPPPPPNMDDRFKRQFPTESYKFAKPRLVGHFV
ncbi:hypothetical protein EB093_08920 [bacterium]|nr:hypothetical protein [bacterium]